MGLRSRIFSALTLALTIALSASVLPAAAHGFDPGPAIQAEPVGPYRLTVWCAPEGSDQISVELSALVTLAADNQPALASNVIFEFEPLDGVGDKLTIRARPGNPATQFIHKTSLASISPGRYHVTVSVFDPAGLGGQAGFDVDLRPVPGWVKGLVVALLVQAALAMAWLLKEGITVWRRKEI